jgi:hypothetical protein
LFASRNVPTGACRCRRRIRTRRRTEIRYRPENPHQEPRQPAGTGNRGPGSMSNEVATVFVPRALSLRTRRPACVCRASSVSFRPATRC